MDTNKYKSVSIDVDTYQLIKALADEQDRSKSATIRRLVNDYCEFEAKQSLLDSRLKSGSTPRMQRLLADLRWYRDNSSSSLDKEWIIDSNEAKAIKTVIAALADSVE